jgi:hypothetical protein
MPQCPQCSKPLMSLSRQCPTCRADLDLLVDYVSTLQENLVRADQLTRAGELGQAMWAYLEVLEVDPDNAMARQQVSQIATAVRQFDRTSPGRRWVQGMPAAGDEGNSWVWIKAAAMAMVVVFAFTLGFAMARTMDPSTDSPVPVDTKKAKEKVLPGGQDKQLGRPPGLK